MKKLLMIAFLLPLLVVPVSAIELQAPTVPESARQYMPTGEESFGVGLLQILRDALMVLRPDLRDAARVCIGIVAVVMVVSALRSFGGMSAKTADLAGTVSVAVLLLKSAGTMIQLGAQTVAEISAYGRLLLPVMSAALAAQGGVTSSAALYTGTLIFDTALSSATEKLITPLIYLFLALSVAANSIGEELLKNLQGIVKWLMTWVLKTILYVFTGYIGMTGVVSGTTDAAALKAAKLTISGVVPVVGGILSDASEAILVSAGTVKNAAGIYGMFAILAIWIGPFLKIGTHYLLLKGTAALCAIFAPKQTTDLIADFSSAMGLLLAMTGTVCLLLMISTICFMKGVG